MKIEVGKSYINAKGAVVKIEFEQIDILYPYVCRYYSYAEDGRRIIGQESPQDLICEVVPEIAELYFINPTIPRNSITQREFIKRHIEYWTENE